MYTKGIHSVKTQKIHSIVTDMVIVILPQFPSWYSHKFPDFWGTQNYFFKRFLA